MYNELGKVCFHSSSSCHSVTWHFPSRLPLFLPRRTPSSLCASQWLSTLESPQGVEGTESHIYAYGSYRALLPLRVL